MEAEKHYFLEGLFIIGLSIAAALAFMWLAKTGHRDDVAYRIHFAESVSGLALGDPVKYRGVDVGTVKAMTIEPKPGWSTPTREDEEKRVRAEIIADALGELVDRRLDRPTAHSIGKLFQKRLVPIEDLYALFDRHGRPLGKGRARRLHGGIDLRGGGHRHPRDHVAAARVVDIEEGSVGRNEAAADVVLKLVVFHE